MDAEAVLLVDDHETEIGIVDAFLEERVGTDDNLHFAGGDGRQLGGTGAAGVAAGQQHDRQPGRLAELRQAVVMLACKDLGRGEQGRLGAGFGRCGHRHQRDDGLAGTDIALQQPQHAVRRGHVGMDLGDRRFLPLREREGQGRAQQAGHPPGSDERPSAGLLHALARQGEGELAGEIFVIGKARPGRARLGDVGLVLRIVKAAKCAADVRIAFSGNDRRIDPFLERRQPVLRLGDRLAQELGREPGGHRIDRLDQRQGLGFLEAGDEVGVDHGRAAVEPLDPAGDDHRLADRQQLFQPRRLAAEIGEGDLAGLVLGEDAVGHRFLPAARCLVPVDPDRQGDDAALGGGGDLGALAPVDQPARQMEQEIAHPHLGAIADEQGLQLGRDFRSHAFQRGDGGEEGVEEGGAHGARFSDHADEGKQRMADLLTEPIGAYMRGCSQATGFP